ncbi:hypothetical protein XCV0609 [Xanthomonas euvesicatoria pv. vesicatoria str. 85-10]|uniref:Uncharacterized protein n=1 Tax=Xanthomonas euvesicatoria pv. vesicatoria (strain 85-10) TaxID=316273 RepID=Q3BY23_XANE5|nr:hypothetical protein XCV0609 [Xanthomonas euvesicatoria pv. vesicatoria str. 85-10]
MTHHAAAHAARRPDFTSPPSNIASRRRACPVFLRSFAQSCAPLLLHLHNNRPARRVQMQGFPASSYATTPRTYSGLNRAVRPCLNRHGFAAMHGQAHATPRTRTRQDRGSSKAPTGATSIDRGSVS